MEPSGVGVSGKMVRSLEAALLEEINVTLNWAIMKNEPDPSISLLPVLPGDLFDKHSHHCWT
jgi:hypothetical protein